MHDSLPPEQVLAHYDMPYMTAARATLEGPPLLQAVIL